MSAFGSGSNSNGNFWYGNSTGFPGFLYKKNVGVGGRRSTKFAAGGNITCNSATYLYNKYTPGSNGVGASTIANRRAKNRLASVCLINNKCFPCFNTLGQYNSYTGNPNGFIPCPPPLPYSATGIFDVSSNSQYNTIIIFTGNGSITFTSISSVQYLLVGGGGGGGYSFPNGGGGGGGGEVLTGFFNTEFETFDITIGKGGNGVTDSSAVQNGSNSLIISMTTTIASAGGLGSTGLNGGNSGAGGAGGIYYSGSVNPPPSSVNGTNGGGGAAGSTSIVLAGNGGLNSVNPNYGGGGGGGSGNGFISGGLGVGGGGNGGNTFLSGQNGTPNRGGGGGGIGYAAQPNTSGGNGGSGVCIFYFNV